MSQTDTPPEFSDSDQRWLDALLGKGSTVEQGNDALDAVVQEAVLMREALAQEKVLLERSAAFQSMNDPSLREHKLQALLFDMQRQALLQPKVDTKVPKQGWWRWATPLGFAMAAVVGFAVLLPMLVPTASPEFSEPPVWRGGQAETVRLVSEPLKQARGMQERLKKAGVWAAIYQQGQDYVLDVDVDAAQLSEVAHVLTAEGIPVRAGLVRIRFAMH